MLKESRDGIELVAMVGCRLDFLMVVSTKVSLALRIDVSLLEESQTSSLQAAVEASTE
jgi:hypothetical protein